VTTTLAEDREKWIGCQQRKKICRRTRKNKNNVEEAMELGDFKEKIGRAQQHQNLEAQSHGSHNPILTLHTCTHAHAHTRPHTHTLCVY
jgi:hypothetical protein